MYEATRARAQQDPDLPNLERFYQQLLLLDVVADPEPVLAQTLESIVELTGARLAYVEVVDDEATPATWRGHAANAASLDSIRAQISYGIVRRAIAERRTIETTSAFRDERFQ